MQNLDCKKKFVAVKNTASEIAAIDVLKVTFLKYCFSLILNCLDAEKIFKYPVKNFQKFKNFIENFQIKNFQTKIGTINFWSDF